jgi:hypothetical protein|nr:MAG TPA: N-acetylmuramoyl-L-alanine amidase [Caudoviricetes sp.]
MSFWLGWAVHKPLKINFTPKSRSRTDGIILHVAASEAASLHGWFSNPKAAASSHLYVRRDGTVEQYVDLDQISWASVRGDLRCISVETQGGATGRWTEQQVSALARIVRETSARYGYPLRTMGSSAASERGVGWHALGVPASRSQRSAGVSQTGGELWSGAPGKVCPGAERVPQIPGIVELARGGLQEGEDELNSEQDRKLDISANCAARTDYGMNASVLPTLSALNEARVQTENTLNEILGLFKDFSGRLARIEKELFKDAS